MTKNMWKQRRLGHTCLTSKTGPDPAFRSRYSGASLGDLLHSHTPPFGSMCGSPGVALPSHCKLGSIRHALWGFEFGYADLLHVCYLEIMGFEIGF